MTEKYNGWTNYETWNYALWLGNDQGSDEQMRELAQNCWNDAEADKTFSREERATLDMAGCIQQMCNEDAEQWMPAQCGPFSDAVNAYISEINWYEIAGKYIEDADKEASDDSDS